MLKFSIFHFINPKRCQDRNLLSQNYRLRSMLKTNMVEPTQAVFPLVTQGAYQGLKRY